MYVRDCGSVKMAVKNLSSSFSLVMMACGSLSLYRLCSCIAFVCIIYPRCSMWPVLCRLLCGHRVGQKIITLIITLLWAAHVFVHALIHIHCFHAAFRISLEIQFESRNYDYIAVIVTTWALFFFYLFIFSMDNVNYRGHTREFVPDTTAVQCSAITSRNYDVVVMLTSSLRRFRQRLKAALVQIKSAEI